MQGQRKAPHDGFICIVRHSDSHEERATIVPCQSLLLADQDKKWPGSGPDGRLYWAKEREGRKAS